LTSSIYSQKHDACLTSCNYPIPRMTLVQRLCRTCNPGYRCERYADLQSPVSRNTTGAAYIGTTVCHVSESVYRVVHVHTAFIRHGIRCFRLPLNSPTDKKFGRRTDYLSGRTPQSLSRWVVRSSGHSCPFKCAHFLRHIRRDARRQEDCVLQPDSDHRIHRVSVK
jgi:hypothetical protein